MADTGHGRAPIIHHVPATTNRDRPHELADTCWCDPVETSTLAGDRSVLHRGPDWRDEAKVHLDRIQADVKAMVVRTPRKRSHWGRPWGRR